MRKIIMLPLAAALSLGVAACQSKQADAVEDAAENKADAIDNMADHAPTEAQEDALHNQADAVEEAGENAADAIDNGSAANTM
jgi:hypothetical protein